MLDSVVDSGPGIHHSVRQVTKLPAGPLKPNVAREMHGCHIAADAREARSRHLRAGVLMNLSEVLLSGCLPGLSRAALLLSEVFKRCACCPHFHGPYTKMLQAYQS